MSAKERSVFVKNANRKLALNKFKRSVNRLVDNKIITLQAKYINWLSLTETTPNDKLMVHDIRNMLYKMTQMM